jgi:hypothetical protein
LTKYLRKQKKRKIYFGSQFQRFQSMVTWIHFSWACGEAEHYGGKYMWYRRLFTSSWPGSSGKGTGERTRYHLQEHTHNNLLIPTGSTSWLPLPPNIPVSCEFINGLINYEVRALMIKSPHKGLTSAHCCFVDHAFNT